MSPTERAFELALDSAAIARGLRETVNFRGEDLDALIEEAPIDLHPIGGGYVDGSLMTVSLRNGDITLPVSDEGVLELINIRGREMEVLTYEPLAGRVRLVCGLAIREE